MRDYLDQVLVSLKDVFRTRSAMFWLLLYPFFMVSIFHFSFAKVDEGDLRGIKVGMEPSYVNEAVFPKIGILDVTRMDRDAGKKAVEQGSIAGYIQSDLELYLTGENEDGLLLYSLVKDVKQMSAHRMKAIAAFEEPLYATEKTSVSLAYFLHSFIFIYFVSNSSYGALASVLVILPTRSHLGLRAAISPQRKSVMLGAGLMATFLTQVLVAGIMVFFSELVYKQGLILHWPGALLVMLMGILWSAALGLAIGVLVKAQESMYTTLLTMLSLAMGLMAGMMGSNIRQAVDRFLPGFNRLNPLALIHDAFTHVNQYAMTDYFWATMARILAITLLFFFVAIFVLRRQSYAHL